MILSISVMEQAALPIDQAVANAVSSVWEFQLFRKGSNADHADWGVSQVHLKTRSAEFHGLCPWVSNAECFRQLAHRISDGFILSTGYLEDPSKRLVPLVVLPPVLP